jgi:hypothetical protein
MEDLKMSKSQRSCTISNGISFSSVIFLFSELDGSDDTIPSQNSGEKEKIFSRHLNTCRSFISFVV